MLFRSGDVVVCRRRKERRTKDKGEDDEEGGEGPSAGDVFALEMELNRENKKMMKVSLLVCVSVCVCEHFRGAYVTVCLGE